MKKNRILLMLIFLLIGISLFSVFQYISALRGKQSLVNSFNRMRSKTLTLEAEKQQLIQELEEQALLAHELMQDKQLLQADIKVSQDALSRLQEELIQAENSINALYSEIEILKQDNLNLRQDRDKILQEKKSLQVQLTSLSELKKAIRELKRQTRKKRATKMRQDDQLVKGVGNRGFIIKDGRPTLGAKVRIEVIPVR